MAAQKIKLNITSQQESATQRFLVIDSDSTFNQLLTAARAKLNISNEWTRIFVKNSGTEVVDDDDVPVLTSDTTLIITKAPGLGILHY